MNRPLISALALATLAACGATVTTDTEAISRGAKVSIEHNGDIISVSENAVAGHLRHGDCLTSVWYADLDEDCQGDAGDSIEACDQPSGYTDNADDADDAEQCIAPDGAMPSDKTIGVEDDAFGSEFGDDDASTCCTTTAGEDLAALEQDYEEVGAESADMEGEEDVEEY
jgi:hypothetical protein